MIKLSNLEMSIIKLAFSKFAQKVSRTIYISIKLENQVDNKLLQKYVPEVFLSRINTIIFDFKDYTIYKPTNDSDQSSKIMKSQLENFQSLNNL